MLISSSAKSVHIPVHHARVNINVLHVYQGLLCPKLVINAYSIADLGSTLRMLHQMDFNALHVVQVVNNVSTRHTVINA